MDISKRYIGLMTGCVFLIRIKRARDEQLRQCASAISMASMNSKTPSKTNLEEAGYDGDVKVSFRDSV